MGAAFVCLLHVTEPQSTHPSKSPKMLFFGLKMAIFDGFAIFSKVWLSLDLLFVLCKMKPSNEF